MRLRLPMMALAFFICLGLSGLASPETTGDPVKGKVLFDKRCAECHAVSLDGSAQGPSLSGVVGRRSAAVSQFKYTRELRAAKLIWDEATLNKYVANPNALVPGTKCAATITDADERRNLIAFLRTTKGPAIQPARTNILRRPIESTDTNR